MKNSLKWIWRGWTLLAFALIIIVYTILTVANLIDNQWWFVGGYFSIYDWPWWIDALLVMYFSWGFHNYFNRTFGLTDKK